MEYLPSFLHLNLLKIINKIDRITTEATDAAMRIVIFRLLECLLHEPGTQRSGLPSRLLLKDQTS